jgi:hypothetical protein
VGIRFSDRAFIGPLIEAKFSILSHSVTGMGYSIVPPSTAKVTLICRQGFVLARIVAHDAEVIKSMQVVRSLGNIMVGNGKRGVEDVGI